MSSARNSGRHIIIRITPAYVLLKDLEPELESCFLATSTISSSTLDSIAGLALALYRFYHELCMYTARHPIPTIPKHPALFFVPALEASGAFFDRYSSGSSGYVYLALIPARNAN